MKQTIRIFSVLMVSLALMACGGGSGSDEPQLVTEQRIVTRIADGGFSPVLNLVDDLERSYLLPDYNYMENTYDEKGRLDIQYLSETGVLDDDGLYDTCTYVYSEEGHLLTRDYDFNDYHWGGH